MSLPQQNNLFLVRPTGILIENEKMLIVKQKVNDNRGWSLPGGKLERGETIEQALIRELNEETGLTVEVTELLYVCDKTDTDPPVIHVTFLVKRTGGEITLPTNEFESTPIYDVKMIEIDDLTECGFSKKFVDIVKSGFPDRGSYKGDKGNIGL